MRVMVSVHKLVFTIRDIYSLRWIAHLLATRLVRFDTPSEFEMCSVCWGGRRGGGVERGFYKRLMF